jgi:hypothetical protein
VNAKKPLDARATMEEWTAAWDAAIATLENRAD